MLKRRAFLLLASSALLLSRSALAGFLGFNVALPAGPPTKPSSAGQIASIPLGNFTGEYTGSGGSVTPNSDGTTNGWTSNAGWLILQYWFYFPSDDNYTFVIPAYVNTAEATAGNSMMVYIDQLMIPCAPGNVTNNNWFSQFVTNVGTAGVGPSQNYTYNCPVRAGWHSIQIMMNTNAYYGISGGGSNSNIHGDRLNIIATGTGLPAEPEGMRDPGISPMSSYHFINTPFGAAATWLSLSNPIAQTINGGGGNGANISVATSSDSDNWFEGSSGSPTFSVSSSDTIQCPTPTVSLVYPVRLPAGTYPSFGGDGGLQLTDGLNPRFRYTGFGAGSVRGRTVNYYRMGVQDSYNLNHASPQSFLGGYGMVTNADLNSGAILHRLIGGLATANAPSTTIGYGKGTQTSEWSGMPWPACESDHDWTTRYSNSNGPPYGAVIGIPPSVTKPGGLNAATSMAWDAMQHYGCFLNVSAGNVGSPTIQLYAEGAAATNPLLSEINWATIVPNLSVMTNPAPIVVGQGFGGGSPVVSLLPGLVQGYPSLGLPPYTAPTSPVGIPIQINPSAISVAISSGTAFGSANVASTLPIGSFVLAFFSFDRTNSAVSFTSVVDSAGNTYSLIQPPTGTATFHPLIAVCLSTTHAIASGTTWTPVVSPTGQVNYFLLGVYYRPAPSSGSPSLHSSNSASSASGATSASLGVTVTANDLVIGFTYLAGTQYPGATPTGSINTSPGMTTMNNFPPLSIDMAVAPSSGTFTYNPSWVTSNPYGALVASFTNVNVAA